MASHTQANDDNLVIVPYTTNNLAIVPYEPLQQTIPTLSQDVLAPWPLSYAFPSDVAVPTSSARRSSRTSKKSEQIFIHLFALNLPLDCVEHLSTKDHVLRERRNEINRASQEPWFPILERLVEWKCEIRSRLTRNRVVDKYFYHANMKLRSVKELRFFVKYGFMPRKSHDKETHTIVEEGGSSRRSPSYLDYKEEELISKCKLEKHIIEKINHNIKVQLLWTKHHPEET